MITDWLPANSVARWRAMSSLPMVWRAFTLLALGGVILVACGREILLHHQPDSLQLFGLLALPLQFFAVWTYIFWWYPLRASHHYPREPRHPLLLLLIVTAYINTAYVFSFGITGGAEPWILIMLFMMMATPCGTLPWVDSMALLGLMNFGLFHWLLPATPWHIPMLMMACQGVLLLLMRGMMREVSQNTEARLRVMELQATQELLRAQAESETRNAIGQDLHDELGHLTTIISNNLSVWLHQAQSQSAAQPDPLIVQSADLMRQLQAEARQLSHRLQRRAFDLSAALSVLRQQVQALSIETVIEGFDGRCDARIGEAVFRSCQESLTNALRHSDATYLRFHLRQHEQWLHVIIQDNGSVAKAFIPGQGLKGIKRRVAQLGGQCRMHCGQTGFRTELRIPL